MKQKKYTDIKYQISHDSKLLFIGTNPSPGTYARKVPFSNNKSFWYLLHDAGFLLEDHDVLQNDALLKQIFYKKFTKSYHLGLINLVFRPTKSIAEIKRKEAIPGRIRIISAIKKYKPKVVCFVGKGTYQLFIQKSQSHYGWQDNIGSSKIYVMHSPIHGLSRIRIQELRVIGKAAGLLH
jgi:double-stranded uracil-DNA glycosylase